MTPEEIILEMNWTFDSDPGRFQLWEQLIKPAMIRFASLNRQGWTRVEDGLPEEEDDVIVYMSKMGHGNPGSAYVGVYEKGKWKIVDTVDGIIQDANNNPDYWIVTHWMPLPNKPSI